MTEDEMKLDMLVAELDYENRLLRARNAHLEKELAEKTRPWVGLTDEERVELCGSGINGKVFQEVSRWIEDKLKEKNT